MRISLARVARPFFSALLCFVICGLGVCVAQQAAAVQVDKIFADLEKEGSPGCALAVFRHGKTIYEKGYGLASVELNSRLTPQSVFDIGSTSKQFTASSILLLEQQGKLSVHDDVRKYIPELPDYSKTYGTGITILNLLNHTSGLRDYLALLALSGVSSDSVTTDDDALALITRQQALNFTPGSEWEYSNTGFFLQSIIVKRASGMTLREFASKNIFGPLQMAQTSFRDDHTMLIPNRALAYDPAEKGGYKLNVSYYEQLGDGAVHTSVEDLGKWDENFYSAHVGGKNFLDELQERGRLTNGKELQYAKGLFIGDTRGLRTVRHGGAWGGYRAELLRFPDQHFSVACLCNLSNANPEKRADEVVEIYLGSLMKPRDNAAQPDSKAADVSLTPAQMSALAGTYRNEDKHQTARISVANNKLQWEIYGSTFALKALSPTEFVPIKFPADVKITFNSAAGPDTSTMNVSGDEMLAATYKKITEFVPSAAELAAYAGDFASPELGVIYRLAVVNGALQLTDIVDPSGIPRTGMPGPKALRPTIKNEFEISSLGMIVSFEKNGNEVAGFDLGAGRSRGIKFSRTTQLHNAKTF